MNEQLSFMPNGNIAPCPYREKCTTYKIGCQGISYWCKHGEEMKNESKRPSRAERHDN